MTVEKIKEVLEAEVLTAVDYSDKEAEGCYVCDLLSLAMSKVEANDAWVTVQANVNIAAVAVLTEAACVIVAENMSIEESVIEKANSEGVIIMRTGKSAFECAVEIGKLI